MTASSDPATLSDILNDLYRGMTEGAGWQPFLTSVCRWLEADSGRIEPPISLDPPVTIGEVPVFKLENGITDRAEQPNPILEVRFGGGRAGGSLTLFRDDRRPGFGPLERSRIDLVTPHLQRALELRKSLESARLSLSTSRAALEHIAAGLAFVTSRGAVHYGNQAFHRLATDNDGFSIVDGYLVASNPETQNEFAEFLRQDYDRRRDRLTLHFRSKNGSIYHATIRMLDPGRIERRLALENAPKAILMFGNVTNMSRPDPNVIATDFGLTISEARLVSAMVGGSDLPTYAKEVGISIHTVRTHLKNVFSKLGATSQANLIRIVLANPSRLRAD